MKKVLYIILVLFCIGCSHKQSKDNSIVDSMYIAPDSVWDYSYVDSIDKSIKAYSYKIYGDSNMMDRVVTEGLPDSMMLHNK